MASIAVRGRGGLSCRLDERDVRRGEPLGVRALDPSSTLGPSLSLSVSAGVPGIRASV